MSKLYIPENYKPALTLYRKQRAIEFIKNDFQKQLARRLNLKRVSAPLVIFENTGMNDNLNGYERPVSFDIPDIKTNGEIVHSLAKWKRVALKNYDFKEGNGLYTDMNAIRRDEEVDNLHSIYVDQWDWEKIISLKDRNVDYLLNVVSLIVEAIATTSKRLNERFKELNVNIPDTFYSLTSQELLDMYPNLSAKERENEITKKYGVVFIRNIGDKLSNNEKHDGRAPDYDDWNLNGDLLYYSDILNCAIELSSMGIRVNKEVLLEQLKKDNKEDRLNLAYHKALVNNELPQTIGGGIGQSRLCMLLIGCAHIGEVQASLWDANTLEECWEKGIEIL